MNWLGFILYYLKLRFDVLIGKRRTAHPLEIKWRWKNWTRQRRLNKIKLF